MAGVGRALRSIANRRRQYTRKSLGLSLLGELPLSGELNVILVEYDLLDIVRRHLAHKKRLRVAVFVALDDLVLEAQELQYLLEHGRSDRALLRQALRHLGSRLLSVDLDRLLAISELVQLPVDLGPLPFEFLL